MFMFRLGTSSVGHLFYLSENLHGRLVTLTYLGEYLLYLKCKAWTRLVDIWQLLSTSLFCVMPYFIAFWCPNRIEEREMIHKRRRSTLTLGREGCILNYILVSQINVCQQVAHNQDFVHSVLSFFRIQCWLFLEKLMIFGAYVFPFFLSSFLNWTLQGMELIFECPFFCHEFKLCFYWVFVEFTQDWNVKNFLYISWHYLIFLPWRWAFNLIKGER